MSPEPALRTVTRTQGANAALKDFSVGVRGASLDFEEVPVLVDAFRRMVRGLEFDVCEMAFTTYLCAKSFGVAFTALPIFLVRGFHHGSVVVAADGGIHSPADLAGRRVGVHRGYTVTTGVWARAILAEEYGLDLDGVTWVISGDEHVSEYRAPANVEMIPRGATLSDLLAAGELAAVVGAPPGRPGEVALIPDPEEAAFTALRDRALYPINHLVVVRSDLLAARPELAAALFDSFVEAKNRYVRSLAEVTDPGSLGGQDHMYRRVMDLTGADPLPYGVNANRAMIDALVDHAVAQKILGRRMSADEIFTPSTLGSAQ